MRAVSTSRLYLVVASTDCKSRVVDHGLALDEPFDECGDRSGHDALFVDEDAVVLAEADVHEARF